VIERDLNGTRVGSNVADHRRAVAHLDGHVAVVDLQRESGGGRHAVVEVVAHVHLTRVEDVDHHLRLGAARDGSLREEEIENGRAADLSIGRLSGHVDPDRIAADRVAPDQRRLPPIERVAGSGRGGPESATPATSAPAATNARTSVPIFAARLISVPDTGSTDRGAVATTGSSTDRVESSHTFVSDALNISVLNERSIRSAIYAAPVCGA